jgi:hypothetical protein
VNFGRFYTDLKFARKIAIFRRFYLPSTFKSRPIGEKLSNLVTLTKAQMAWLLGVLPQSSHLAESGLSESSKF